MINIPSTFRISLRALRVNKMRSGLTMLGMIIGVGAVIAMLAVGTGARQKIAEQISSMGSNLIMVLSGASTSGGIRMGAGTQPTLSLGDADAVGRECPSVQAVAPILGGTAQVVYGNQNWSTSVTGTSPNMLIVRDWTLSSGRPFSDDDVKSATKVCLIGQTIVDNLFGSIDPVGQVIRVKKIPFTVMGVLEAKGQSPNGQDQDDTIFVPITTAQKKLFGTAFPGMIRLMSVKARSAEDLVKAEQEITDLLRQRHRLSAKQENDFTVRNLTQMLQTAEQSTKVMTILLGAIASVSLVVGGIGIMNIMLATVLERTREIGIRRAIGARRKDVLVQFVVEAFTLSALGGILGVVLGVAIAKVVAASAGWPTVVTAWSLLLSTGVSGAVGLLSGFYPALRAASIDPIEALRYE